MTTLVVGASGATGRLVVDQLLLQGQMVKVVVRAGSSLPAHFQLNKKISITYANLLDLSDEQLIEQVQGCEAVVCCLGHNLSFKGIFGQPRRLVTEATQRLCQAVEATKPKQAIKFILMNSVGNQNKAAGEKVSLMHSAVILLLRACLPPHPDNEQAAAFLQRSLMASPSIEWVAVRPDSLIDEPEVSAYSLHPSPIRDALFDSGKTSRINVAHFMVQLITQPALWQQWRGQLPVIYND